MYNLTIQDSNGQQVFQVSFAQGSYVIGRLDGCDIVLPSSSVSRQHARIFVLNGRCYIEDMGSANGIMVDGQRVVGRRDLGTASQLRLGDYYLYLEFQRPNQNDEQRVLQTLFIPQDEDLFKLVRIGDNFAGEEFILSEVENTIGRTDENFILLSDPSISRHHAKIFRHADTYQVQDLGSSNGSTINGKPLKAPVILSSGDQVKFGNVEFVFVEGNRTVDARAYQSAPQQSSKLYLIIAVAILLVVGIAIGATMLFGLNSLKQGEEPSNGPAQAQEARENLSVDSKLDKLKADAKKARDDANWDTLSSVSREILSISPDDEEALAMKTQAAREQDAASLVKQAGTFAEKGSYEEARNILETVPEDTQAYANARASLEHIYRTLAHQYKTEALDLEKKRSTWKEAHTLLIKAIKLTPDDESLLQRIQKLEKNMKKRRIRFTAYEPAE